jgi:predicted transcriptional regulator
MVLVVAKVLFPHAKSSEVAKKNIEMIQKYPADPSLGEGLVIGVKATTDGIKALFVGEAKEGKVEEFMSYVAKQYQETALEIEGYKYQLDHLFYCRRGL